MLPHVLAATLPHRDFVMLQHYAARKALPHRRLELYLAQAAWAPLRAAGAKDANPSDFLLGAAAEAESPPDDADLDDLRRELGFPDRSA